MQSVFVNVWLVLLMLPATLLSQEWKSGVEWEEPKVVTPGAADNAPPSDAIVLFDGSDLSKWEGGEKWLIEDGAAIPKQGNITTKQAFGDVQVHLEWSAPTKVEGEGQGRGNSGVFLMDEYEVQILDSFENQTYFDGQAGAVYKQTPPMVNAMRKPGEWNTYDIIFTAPKFRVDGELSQPAYVTVIHNGMVVLNHFEILGATNYTQAPDYTAHAEIAPIRLQFHGDPVKFRNIWVRELNPPQGKRVQPPYNVVKEKPKKKTKKEAEKKKEEKEEKKPQEPKSEESKSDESKSDQSKSEESKSDQEKPKNDADPAPEEKKEADVKPEEDSSVKESEAR